MRTRLQFTPAARPARGLQRWGRYWLVLVLVLASWLSAQAQCFQGTQIYGVGSSPQSVAIGDINRDGNIDLVTANYVSHNVSVLLSDGSGRFGAATNYEVGAGPLSVAIGDVNADGRLDIVTANYDGNLTVLVAQAAGGYVRTSYGIGYYPYGLALGDVNADGRLDIVTTSISNNSVTVLVAQAAGGYIRSDYGAGDMPYDVALGDVNADGRLDIVTANYNGNTVTVLVAQAAGGYIRSSYGVGNGPIYSVALGDVNADGRLDIVTTSGDDALVTVLVAQATGGYVRSDYGVDKYPISLALGDINADGRLDIVTANSNINGKYSVTVLVAQAAGGYARSDYGLGDMPYDVALGDVNADGRLDIVTVNYNKNYVSVLLNAPPTLAQSGATNPSTCGGNQGSISFTTTNLANGTYTLSYSVGGNARTASITVSNNGFILGGLAAGSYSGFSINSSGCVASLSGPISLTQPAPPTVNLSNNGPLTCALTSVTLTASGTTGSTYAFRDANGFIASSGNTASVSSPGAYTVTASLNGCTSTTTTTVGINTTPPTVSISPSATAICAGQSVTLAANASTSGGTLSYRWNTNATTSSISVSATGPYSVSVTRSDNGCVATATASVTVTPLPSAPQVAPITYCQGQQAGPLSVTASPGGSLRYYTSASGGTPFSSIQPSTATPGTTTYYVSQVNAQGCESNRVALPVTVAPLPSAPSLVTQSGYPYPAGVSSLTLSQNVGPVSLTAIGCSGGMIMASGNAASSLTITTAMTGTQTYTATCTSNGCTGPAGSFQLTVLPTTLSVLHRDADYGNTQNNVIKPYLELANTGGQSISYGDITVRYWFTSEGQAPPTNLTVYYAQLGAVSMTYVPLSQPRQGAFGYVEYSFPGGGSLAVGGNSGPIENAIQKTDGSNFNESDDYSYAANYQDYVPNPHITAYRNGVIFYGQEPTTVSSQTAVQVYSAAKDSPTTSQIQPRLELRNTGNVALPVSSLKLRYYFTSDNNQTASVYVDYADIGASNVQAQVVRLGSPVNGADSYVELSFPGSTMMVNALSSLGVIDFRIVRSDYGLFDQTNDYSYAPNYGNVGLNDHVTAYLGNQLVFGTPPSGAAARVGASEPVSLLQVKVLGNPVLGSHAQVEIRGAEGQPVNLRLVDLQGRAIHEQRIEQATETESVRVPLGESRGLLLLQVSIPGQQQRLKLVRP